MTLSQNRAQAVADYLSSRGVAPARIRAQGFGKTRRSRPTPRTAAAPPTVAWKSRSCR
jgi:outer membrane protein OmpA-like peptidoglycan-associated protein